LFEALPKRERRRIVNIICRTLPTITSKHLSWSESQVSALEQILHKKNGITIVQGSEIARNYVISALGHSSRRLSSEFRETSGVDVRFPANFVPVPGIIYLNQPMKLDVLIHRTKAAWASLDRKTNCTIFINGVWCANPNLHAEVKLLSLSKHILIGDDLHFSASEAIKAGFHNADIITASAITRRRIKVAFQAA
jgi:hypothetical protein